MAVCLRVAGTQSLEVKELGSPVRVHFRGAARDPGCCQGPGDVRRAPEKHGGLRASCPS